jgi:hypothetical protein
VLAAMLALTLAGCDDGAPVEAPKPPAMLLAPAEDPFGDAVRSRITRATVASYDALEPRFGRLTGEPFAIQADRRAALVKAMQAGLPKGWARVDLTPFAPRDAELLAFANDGAMFGLLIVDPGQGDLWPVMVLRNDKASR